MRAPNAKRTHSPAIVRAVDHLALREGSGRIAVIADTHSEPHPRALELVAREEPDCILHAGDIGDLSVVRDFAAVAPTWPVLGNIDDRTSGLPDLRRIEVTRDGERFFAIMLFHIAVAGPRLRADAARLAHGEGVELVVCGHSHVPFIGRDRGLAIFNPGSIGPRRFHLPIVFGMMNITPEGVRMKHVDCETGADWSP